MTKEAIIPHIPVLLEQAIKSLDPHEGGLYLDGTLGFGGHAQALMEAAGGKAFLCAIDRDATALTFAKNRLEAFSGQIHYFHNKYSQFEDSLNSLNWDKLDGAIIDIGLSSLQIDDDTRGFSFKNDGHLDMRMDQGESVHTAWNFVNGESFEVLKDCILKLGEDPQAGRIARAIVAARQKSPIDTTTQLAAIIFQAYPPVWRAKARNHPATRTFQAIRMLVNDELGELESFMQNILKRLKIGGRLVVICFHSLEDRIVKRSMKKWAKDCYCPVYVPRCICNHRPEIKILFKRPLKADIAEIKDNPRASSAKLRALEKIAEFKA